jgi:hypothetical protein
MVTLPPEPPAKVVEASRLKLYAAALADTGFVPNVIAAAFELPPLAVAKVTDAAPTIMLVPAPERSIIPPFVRISAARVVLVPELIVTPVAPVAVI